MLTRRRTSVTDLNYHLVFVTKYRKQVFTTDQLREEMLQILGKIASGKGVEVQRMEVMPDHVHMLISFHPKEGPSSVVSFSQGVVQATPRDKKAPLGRTPMEWVVLYVYSRRRL